MRYILLLFLSLFATSLPIISFSQVDDPAYPTITQQIPSIEKQSQQDDDDDERESEEDRESNNNNNSNSNNSNSNNNGESKDDDPGYLILATIIINDSGGTKLASDFTVNIKRIYRLTKI
jgi:hypothetical protein